MSSKKEKKENNSKTSQDILAPHPPPVKAREDTIPVIVVNGVYYPSQKLRFKLNDPTYSFCTLNSILI